MYMPRLRFVLRLLALVLTGVMAVFGIPVMIDPPPRDRIVQMAAADGATRRRRRGPRA
jgi:hypothetical protein